MKKLMIVLMISLISNYGCSDSDSPSDADNNGGNQNGEVQPNGEWLVPLAEIRDGGPGKDGIPSIDAPKFLDTDDFRTSYIRDDDLVIGMIKGDDIRAYPHLILDYHEIVNDVLNEDKITLSYCPLTGTAFGWSSISGGSFSTFGVSGLLYNANLILYDRKTDSNWSQLRLQCINGSEIGERPILVNIVETTWGMWRTMYPQTKILSLDTGYARNYGTYPYGPYKVNHDYFVFQATPINLALPNKLRVHAIISGNFAKVYRFESFPNGKVVVDNFNEVDYLVVGNENIIVSFELDSDTKDLNFTYDFNDSETLFSDNEGNSWNAFGEAIDGPRKGVFLRASTSVISYWFAIAAFYPEPVIY